MSTPWNDTAAAGTRSAPSSVLEGATRPSGRRPRLRRLGIVAATVPLLVAAACSDTEDPPTELGGVGPEEGEGGGPDALEVGELDPAAAPEGFEATPEFLRQVVDGTEAVPFRYEMAMNLYISGAGESVETDLEMLSGEQSGATFRQVVDVGQALEDAAEQTGQSVPEELTGDDAVVETVGDTESLFVRAPFVDTAGAALEEIGAANPMYDLLGTLGDGWGYVDLTRAGETVTGQTASGLGNGGFDPRALVDTLREAGEVSELGSADIDGTPVTGLVGETSLGAMLEAQGLDPADFAVQMGAATDVPTEAYAAVTELSLPIEAWLTQDGHLRQVRMVMDLDFMVSLVEATGGDPGSFEDQVDTYEQLFTVDYLDYGDPSIQVELPDPAAATDITDDYVATLDA